MYTGGLFGYYEQELLDDQISCLRNLGASGPSRCTSDTFRAEAATSNQSTEFVRRFLGDDDIVATRQQSLNLLLGMGDNFSPELESRLQRYQWSESLHNFKLSTDLATESRDEFLYPLKRYAARPGHPWQEPDSLDDAMRAVKTNSGEIYLESAFAAQDNVANFLLLAGYTAVVPGRQDFLYGSVRLAKLADLLKTNSRGSLHMLAANLRYQKIGTATVQHADGPATNPVSAANPLPSCPLLFGIGSEGDGSLSPSTAADKCDPKASGDLASLNNAGYKIVSVPGHPDEKILIIGVVAHDALTQVSVLNKTFAKTTHSSERYNLIVTDPQREISTILRGLGDMHLTMTILLAQMPRGDAETLASHFALISSCTGGMRQSMVSAKECPKNHIDVVVTEADEAQATEDETVDLAAQERHLIVLTPYPAYDSFHKDLVYEPLSTAVIDTVQDQPETGILPLHYTNRTKWHVGFANAALPPTPRASGRFGEFTRSFQQDRPLERNHYGIISDDLVEKPDLTDREIATRMLRSVQLQTGADIVLIQRRDLFFDQPVRGHETNDNCAFIRDVEEHNDCLLRNEFQRMLWKGDVLTTTNLTGQQIINVMQTSQQLSDSDNDLTTKDVTRQWLVTFGIWEPMNEEKGKHDPGSCPPRKDDKKFDDLGSFALPASCHCQASTNSSSTTNAAYCVDGKELDPSRVYSVATTDTLATGSDVYSDFKKPAVGTVEDILKKHAHNAGFVENVLDCWHTVSQVDTLVTSPLCASKWPAISKKNIPAGEIGSPAAFNGNPPVFNPNNDDIYEFQHQERGVLHYQLQQLLLSFNEYQPTMSDYSIGQTFGGVSDTRVLQPHNSTIDIEDNFRTFWETRHYDIGVSSILSYTKNIKGSLTGSANNVSYSNDQFSVGPVLQLHAGSSMHLGRLVAKDWNSKSPPDYKLVLSLFQITGQIQRSRFAFADDSQFTKLDPPLSLSLQRVFEPNLQWGTGPRVGFRHEYFGGNHWFYPDKTSFWEGGYQFSFQHSVLTGLQLLNPNNSSAFQIVTCSLESGPGLAACVKAAQTADKNPGDVIVGPSTTFNGVYPNGTVFTRGWYWIGSLNFPLSKNKAHPLSALLQGNGDFFNDMGVANQYATQTRFDVTTSLGLQFPVWGNLSFVPQYTSFLYENQNNRNWLSARTLAIALRWSFDRNSAIGTDVALSYKSPAAGGTQGSSGSSAVSNH
jgi:hypothetical protein